MSDLAIQFDNVGKLYHLGSVGTGTLSHDLNRWWQTRILGKEDPYILVGETNDRAHKGQSDFVWALKDISFDVHEGEVVGIIGKNGAGKSTLLKLLSQVTAPTTGEIRAWGRIASLLEVGTGFHQEMTGRENIYMNGSIMGMTRAEITRKLDAIVDFAGVERYLDTPVKRYSSGMTVRLGFAVAAFLEPEILVVDEVLAVGDAEFQKKAIGKMQDVSRGEGRTVLFVSHNMAAVRRLCRRGVLLENGLVKYIGNIGDTIERYLSNEVIQHSFDGIDGDPDILFLRSASVKSSDGEVYYNSSSIKIEFEISVRKTIPSLVIGFNIFSQFQYPIARADYNDIDNLPSLPPGDYRMVFEIPPYTLSNGSYKIHFDVAEMAVKCYTTEKSHLSFSVEQGEDCFGNAFSESIPIKSSLFREKWLVKTEKI
jgi:lipopolysaccharide transport system ATP-binding protein